MKQRLIFFLRYAIFWIILFIAGRLFFWLYEHNFSFNLGAKEWFLSFIYGIRLDISTTGYILGVTGLILVFTSFFDGKVIHKIIKPFTLLVWIICSMIIVADLELYKNWGYRMDSTPLMYITKPKEALASTPLWLSLLLFAFVILLGFAGNFLYNRYLKAQVLKIMKAHFFTFPALLFLTGSMILPIRGGVGIAPINTGMVYFSEHKFANHAAVNVVWNVMNSLVYRKHQEKTYSFMDNDKAEGVVNQLVQKDTSHVQLVLKEKPNILIIVLESFSSNVMGVLGGKWDATPNLNKLIEEGVVFTNFYANGDRSDKGLVSIFSAYPAQPTTSIMKLPAKTQSLPSLFEVFNHEGYHTAFYYGGDIDFANMRSYFLNAGTREIISDENFNQELNNSKWGVHDEYLFNYLYNDLEKAEQPFFKTVFTLSSHDPFDVPMEPVFKGNGFDEKYLNSIYYTDSCVGVFFNKLKNTPLWDNTLCILVADHGSQRPGNLPNHALEKFKIPMIWLGGVLTDTLKTVNNTGSQIDIAATLLGQLSIDASDFYFSNNLLSNKNKGFAFYTFNDGFAFVSDSSTVIYENTGNHVLLSEGNKENALEQGKAYLQFLMNDYSER